MKKEAEYPGPGQLPIFYEIEQSGIITGFPYTETIFEMKTEFQKALCIRTTAFGRALFLDDILNSTEYDEFIYHEGIVHPAMLRAPSRKRVLIIGGAEGGTLREVLKYRDVEQAVMVDIDGELVAACRAHLSDVYGDPFSDPRLLLLHQDGRNYIEHAATESFDVIIMDINEAMEDSPAQLLFTREFYLLLRQALTDRGIVSIQAEWLHMPFHQDLLATVRSVFAGARQIEVNIPSFMMPTAFILASPDPAFYELEKSSLQKEIASHDLRLNYYSVDMDRKIGVLPPYLTSRKKGRIFTDEELPGYI
ncbi:MAG: hypothetical protein HS115_05575 [Spirochaetales bacterium]|nr:hypothetical protein [Spirochaetales bacterium]